MNQQDKELLQKLFPNHEKPSKFRRPKDGVEFEIPAEIVWRVRARAVARMFPMVNYAIFASLDQADETQCLHFAPDLQTARTLIDGLLKRIDHSLGAKMAAWGQDKGLKEREVTKLTQLLIDDVDPDFWPKLLEAASETFERVDEGGEGDEDDPPPPEEGDQPPSENDTNRMLN